MWWIMNSLKQVFGHYCKDLIVDKAFAKKIHDFVVSFRNRSEEHITFFGGNTLGVSLPKFKITDRDYWFDTIFTIDELDLTQDLHNLPDILAHRHVSGDPFNHLLVYGLHRAHTTEHLTEIEKEQLKMDIANTLNYRYITSIMARWFSKYTADPAIATATYALLSKKFGLKVYGTWGALLDARSKAIIEKSSIHYKAYTEYNNDRAIVYMLNDTQGRIKVILINIRDVFAQVEKDPSLIIKSQSSLVNFDGEIQVKDVQRTYSQYKRYINDIIYDKATFIKPELMAIIADIQPNLDMTIFKDALTYMSKNYGPKHDSDIELLLEHTLNHAINWMYHERSMLSDNKDVKGILVKLRSLYIASRSSDPLVLDIRSISDQLIRKVTHLQNPAIISTARTAVLLYVILRTFSMNYYKH